MSVTRGDKQPMEKSPTGITGFDEVTKGGLAKGRTALICGRPGCGKTLFGIQFLVNGVRTFSENGVFFSFDESRIELAENLSSFGFGFDELVHKQSIWIDQIVLERGEIEETGKYDLGGLFVRIENAIQAANAKRIVLDGIDNFITGFDDDVTMRSEMRRLCKWLKEKGLTSVITAEQGEQSITRNGIMEYISDCVVYLDHRVKNQISTRRLRVIKYRGSEHYADEYPFLITSNGISVFPITSLQLDQESCEEFISTGIPRLNTMLDGKGYYRGSSILVSGTAGTGKSSVATALVNESCKNGLRCFYFAFEESPNYIIRNMRSIGMDLQPWLDNQLLVFHAARPTHCGLEMHLLKILQHVEEYQPDVVVIDPISNLITIASSLEVKSTMTRLIDFLKKKQITALMTNLSIGAEEEETNSFISSLMDTWLLLRFIETNGEGNRLLYVKKSRGMAHSNQTREFHLTDEGIQLTDVYIGPQGVLTGTARMAQEAQEKLDHLRQEFDIENRQKTAERKRRMIQSQIEDLQEQLKLEEEELRQLLAEHKQRLKVQTQANQLMAEARWADSNFRDDSPDES